MQIYIFSPFDSPDISLSLWGWKGWPIQWWRLIACGSLVYWGTAVWERQLLGRCWTSIYSMHEHVTNPLVQCTHLETAGKENWCPLYLELAVVVFECIHPPVEYDNTPNCSCVFGIFLYQISAPGSKETWCSLCESYGNFLCKVFCNSWCKTFWGNNWPAKGLIY